MSRHAFLVFLALFAVANCQQEDDGQYRPERYGADDGKYRPDDEGRYIHQGDGDDGTFRAEATFANPRFAPLTRSRGSNVVRSFETPRQDSSAENYHFVNRFVVDEAAASSPFEQRRQASTRTNVPIGVIGAGRGGGSSSATSQFASRSGGGFQQRSQPVRAQPLLASQPAPVAFPSPVAKAAAAAAPVENPEARSQVLKHDVEVGPEGYRYEYETENGIRAEEEGRIANPGTKSASLAAATGFYEYVGPDGVTYRVDYVADENGFRAVGAHLPTPPPIPREIANVLVERN